LTTTTIDYASQPQLQSGQMQTQKTPVYLKALTLRDISDISAIKEDIKKHMILILRVTPLAQKDVEELRKVVEDLYSYAQSIGGDIARLGEERIVIAPPGVKIWRGAYDLK
jgi:uncharacterized protein